jgi:hypothetical protein
LKRRRAGWIIVASVLAVACLAWVAWEEWAVSPEAALARFYAHDGAEDQLMDPLILAGDKVVSLVIREAARQGMDRRRYAIRFLGNGSYPQALPVLERILADPAEEEYYRGDALRAIYQINPALGTRYARQYHERKDYLGQIADAVLGGDDYVKMRRSYQDALLGRHE